jgi:hypothetical protein
MLHLALAACLALCLAVTVPTAKAQQTASTPAILTVGKQGTPLLTFDRATLERLPQHTIPTSTPWTTGTVRFEGPLLRDVLGQAGARGATISAVAMNDYTVSLPFSDVETYDVIVALKRDGQYMPVRDKGPLWIIYPLDLVAGLQTPAIHSRMIWQLKAMQVD